MFTWILIIIAIAFIFGVIKVEHIKEFTQKYEPKIRNMFNKTKTLIEKKYTEINKNINSQKNTSNEEKKDTNNTDLN